MGVVHYSEEARLDADNIKEYLLALGMDENKAEDFVDEIIDYADSLASFPERGAPLSARIHLATDIRYLISNGWQNSMTRYLGTLFFKITAEPCLSTRRATFAKF